MIEKLNAALQALSVDSPVIVAIYNDFVASTLKKLANEDLNKLVAAEIVRRVIYN